jgi:hypothetical protein
MAEAAAKQRAVLQKVLQIARSIPDADWPQVKVAIDAGLSGDERAAFEAMSLQDVLGSMTVLDVIELIQFANVQ